MLVISFLEIYEEAKRADIDTLLLTKVSEILDDKQKKIFITNRLQGMRRDGLIQTTGKNRGAKWYISNI